MEQEMHHLDSTVLCKYRHDHYGEGCLSLLNMTANKCNPIMVLMEFNLILKTV